MKKKYFTIYFFLVVLLLHSPFIGLTQEVQKSKGILLQSTVKDEQGNPIKGASIFANEGASFTTTDESGNFSITVPTQANLLIEATGFESKVFKPGEYINMKELVLTTSQFFNGEKDDVNIAFSEVKRKDVVGAVSVLNSDEYTDFDNSKWLSDVLGSGRLTGMLGGSNIRGTGTPLFIVDGLPRDISTLTFAEVDQVTVLKDINSSILYGSAAVNGVVLIKTKRGQANRKQMNFSGYYGLSQPKALPKYLSSADYMQLYNEARRNDGLSALYDDAAITNYRSGNPYRYPSVDYYSSEYLKSVKPYFNVNSEFSGGNDIATYYTYINWYQTGSLLNFGAGESAKRNRFNIRGNIDLKINSWIKSAIDAVAVFDNDLQALGNYCVNSGQSDHPVPIQIDHVLPI
jgi:TonB-dependent SusC/RagA subfamily outer membrane receptor